MGKSSNIIFKLFYIACSVLLFGIMWNALKIAKKDSSDLEIMIDAKVPHSDEFQLFFDPADVGYHEVNSISREVVASPEYQSIHFKLPSETKLYGLRIDPGTGSGVVNIKKISIAVSYATWELSPNEIDELFEFNSVCSASIQDSEFLKISIDGEDPYFSTATSIYTTIEELRSTRRPVLWPFLLSLLTALTVLMLLLKVDPIDLAIQSRKDLKRALDTIWNKRTVLAFCMGAITWWLVNAYFMQVKFVDHEVSLIVSGTFTNNDELQVYYSNDGKDWNAEDHLTYKLTGNRQPQLVEFKLEKDLLLEFIRFDLGADQTCVILDSMSLVTENALYTWRPFLLKTGFVKNDHVENIELRDDRLELDISGNDAFLYSRESIASVQEDVVKRSNTGEEAGYFAWALAVLVFFALRGLSPSLAKIPKQKRPAYYLSASFALLIFIPLISRVVPIEPASYNTEKRAMAKKPELAAGTLMEYPKKYNAYYSDNFGYRRLLIRWNALLKGAALGVSPNKDAVLFGKEDWLYYMGEGVDAHHRNAKLFSRQELETIQRKLENRYKWLKDQDIDYYITIPPVKSTIYPEYLPDRMTSIRDTSKLDQLIDHLTANSFMEIIDMRNRLLNAKQKDRIYYKMDTHWNVLGAFYGYQVLIRRIAEDHPEITPMELSDFGIDVRMIDEADLSQMCGLNDVFMRREVMLIPKNKFNATDGRRSVFRVNNFFKYEPEFFDNDSISDLNMVIFRDSYAVYLRPFLSEHFSRSGYMWTPLFHPEVIETEKPHIVIHEVMERFIDDLLLDDPGTPRYVQ